MIKPKESSKVARQRGVSRSVLFAFFVVQLLNQGSKTRSTNTRQLIPSEGSQSHDINASDVIGR
jgi:hypothetical protein